MNRYQFEDLISDYIENKIKSKDKVEFETYFETNTEAKELLDSVRQNMNEMNSAFKIQVDKDFNKKLSRKIKNQSKKREKVRSSSAFFLGFNLSQLSIMVGLFILFLFATIELNNEYKINNFEEDVFSAKETPKTLDKIVKNYQDEKVDTTMVDKKNSKDVDYSKSIKFVND